MPGSDQLISNRVVEVTASKADLDLRELPPLYDAVDPDALDACIDSMGVGEVTFEYAGYTVTVHCGGSIDVADGAGSATTRSEATS